MIASLKQKTLRGVGWTIGARQIQQGVTLVITAILANLLSPADFGLVGMVTILVGLAMILADTGFSAVIVQDQSLGQRHYSTLFWLNLAIGVVVALAFYWSAPAVAWFYGRDELIPLAQVLSVSFVLSSFSSLPEALMRKEMDFKALSVIDTSVHLLVGAIVVLMALNGFGIWSLVAQPLLQQSLKAVLMWWHCSWRPSFLVSFYALRDVFQFSANMLLLRYLHYTMANMDYVIVGRFLGPDLLGIYTLAYKVMFVPIRNICLEIVKVLFPAFSQIQDDPVAFARAYLRALRSTCYVVLPMLMGMVIVAEPFIQTVFGEQWQGAVPVLKLLCFVGMLHIFIALSGVVFRALGRPGLELKINVVRFVLVLPALLVAIQYGLVLFVWVLLIATALFTLVQQIYVGRLLQCDWRDCISALLPPLGVSLVMGALLLWLQIVLASASPLSQLLVLALSGGAIYLLGVALIWWCCRAWNIRFI
ncbi:MOP flippase family protein [Ferrimonas pelagia]|uniref:Lipopolysaccharide biosynthesis protein n=1 Tax=Ferrimonas pelagia TaxID=1177826 RepID=A0ABP9F0G7_9GAMM